MGTLKHHYDKILACAAAMSSSNNPGVQLNKQWQMCCCSNCAALDIGTGMFDVAGCRTTLSGRCKYEITDRDETL